MTSGMSDGGEIMSEASLESESEQLKTLPGVGHDVMRRSRLLDILAASGVVTCAIFLVLMLIPSISGWWPYYVIFSGLLVCCALSILLNRMGRFSLAGHLFLVSLSLSITGVIVGGIFHQQVVGFVIYYFPLVVLAAGMIFRSRATYGFATLSAALIAIIAIVAYFVLDLDARGFGTQVLSIVFPAVILGYLMALVAWLYGNSLERALHQLTERSQDLQAANREIRTFSRTLEDKVEERTHELREFVSMVAHDLRNPLTVIGGYTELLQEESVSQTSARAERALQLIGSNVEHMLRLTDDLLEISRLQSGTVEFDMEVLLIEGVIREVCASLDQQLTDKRLGLKLEVPADLPPVWGDQMRLSQVLTNLLGNAYQYTPSGAIIVGARAVDGCIEIAVSDTGIGIPPEEAKLLFSHFFRGEHQVVRGRKGSGLGLTIARSIVEAHGGDIWAESEEGKGSTFRFTVPLASQARVRTKQLSPAESDDG
jgi:signal transduction histidine kinase